MATSNLRKTVVIPAIALLAALVALGLILHSLEGGPAGSTGAESPAAGAEDVSGANGTPDQTAPGPSVADNAALAPADPKPDEHIEELRDDLIKEFDRLLAGEAAPQPPSTREAVEAAVTAHLADSGPTRAMRQWLRKANDEELALAVDLLTARLRSEADPSIRRRCLLFLGAVPDVARQVLRESVLYDVDRGVRQLAAYMLGDCGTESELDVLRIAVERDEGVPGHGRAIASAAITSIGSIGGGRAAEILTEIWASPRLSSACREQVISAIGSARDPGTLDLILSVLESGDEYIRDNAAYALGRLAKGNAANRDLIATSLSALRLCLTDANANVRANAASALGEVGTREDIARLEALLTDPHSGTRSFTEQGQEKTVQVFPVREEAQQAIDRITARTASGLSP